MRFKRVQFMASVLDSQEYCVHDLPEVGVIGRSNVGKSSLINHLTYSKDVAKVSSTPGKTQCINYFLVDDVLYFVDFPGYGYAKRSKTLQTKWSQWIDRYLKRCAIKFILFLIDSRRGLLYHDILFLKWAQYQNIPLLPILTKADKLAKKKREQSCHFLYSIKEGQCRQILTHKIYSALWG